MVDHPLFSRKLGRNEPCWCGSGQKYKHCHLGRENKSPTKISDVIKQHKKAFGQEMCLCPEEWKGDCYGSIVKAHTVSKRMLERIALGGHVYGFKKHFGAIVSDEGKLRFKKIGINRASVFTGFCSKHDSQIFESIENERFEITPKSAFLLAYRALCYEYFTKKAALEMIPLMRKLDGGRTVNEQLYLQNVVEGLETGFETGSRDLKVTKRHYDEILITQNFESVRYYIAELDRLPSLMCSGCIYPTFDFHGNHLQDLLDLETVLESISLSVIANDEDRGLIAFVWTGSEDGPCDRFVKSYHRLTEYEKAQSIVRFTFEFLENKYLKIDWWDSIDRRIIDALYKRQEIAVNPLQERKADCLTDDAIHYVDWNIIGAHTNIQCD